MDTKIKIVFFLLVLFSVSCSENKLKPIITDIDFIPQEESGQFFYIDPRKDTSLKLLSGNTITFYANSFLSKKEIKKMDSIYIQIYEYNDIHKMINEGITTQFDTSLLKLNYCLYVKALLNNERLTLNKKMRLKIGINRLTNPQFHEGKKKSDGTFLWKKSKVKIDSVYLTGATASISDTIYLYSDYSTSHKVNHDFYYLLDVSNVGLLGFCEEIKINDKESVNINVRVPDLYLSACYLKKYKTYIGHAKKDNNNILFKIPENETFVLICLHREKNKVSYFMKEYTTADANISVENFSTVSKIDFKKKLKDYIK